MPETPAAPKRTRGKRRNFAKEIADIKAYCEATIEILSDPISEGNGTYTAGQIAFANKILAKIGGNSNGRS